MIIGASSSTGFFLIIILVFFVLWLIVVRPQRRRQSQQQQMLQDLRVGDEVLTAGGIYGEIVRLDENEITVEVAPQIEVRVARRAIAGVVSEPESEEPDDSEQTEFEEPADVEESEEPSQEEAGDDSDGGTSAEENPG